jgi:hypothetical protein
LFVNLYCLGVGTKSPGTAVGNGMVPHSILFGDKILVFISTLLMDFTIILHVKIQKLSFLNMICHHQNPTELKILITDE